MKFEGEITEIDLLPKLVELSEQRFTGALRFENDAIIKIVYFKEGEVLSASTNDRADSIDEILLRSNKVSKDHIKQALARRKENETLGDALLNLGFITRKELTWARRAQVIGILRSLGRWTEGSYTLVADYLPKREEGMSFHLPQLVVELLVTEEDRGAVEQAMDGGEAVFELAPGGDETYRRLGLNEDADAILANIDGVKTASDLAQGSSMDTFSVYKLLQALSVLGITQRNASTATAAPMAVAAPAFELDNSLEVSFEDPPPMPAFEVAASEPSAPAPTIDDWTPPSVDRDDYPLDYTDEPLNFDDEPVTPPASTIVPPPPPATAPPREVAEQPILPPPATRSRPAPPAVSFSATAPRRRSKVPIVAVLVLIALAAAGYGAWRFFVAEEVSAPPVEAAVKRPAKRVQPQPPPMTTTMTPSGAAVAPTTATGTVAEIPPPPPQVTPAAVPPPQKGTTAGDPRRARYEQMAREYAAESAASPFAVQVAFVCETASLTAAVESGGSNVWFVPAERGGRVCFRVLWGRYSERAAATKGIASVPARYRTGRPVVVKLSQVVNQ